MSLGLRGPWIMDDVMLTSLLESGCKHEHMLSPNSSRCKDCSPKASPHLCIFSTELAIEAAASSVSRWS